jgi:ABC-type lipoprotein export system ATPase subunit
MTKYHIHRIAPSISCDDISLMYGTRDILLPQDFSLGSHEMILIQWPSGSGKSSLLRMLAWLISPSTWGIIYSCVWSSLSTSSSDFIDFRRRYISLTSAEPLFFDTLTVDENIMFPHIFSWLTYDRSWKDNLIETLGVSDLISTPLSRLSSGEKDRVNIIRALLYDLPVLLLDEPWAHMDRDLFERFIILLQNYLKRVRPLTLIISHSERFAPLVDSLYTCEKWIIRHRH